MEKILDFCDISGKKVQKYEGCKKYIATGDIINNKIENYTEVTYDNKPSRANQQAEIGDVLFAKMKQTKKVILINNNNVNNIYSTGFYIIKPKCNVLSEFLYFLFDSGKFNIDKDKNCKGATQQALNNDGLSKIYINELPNLKDQKVIIEKMNFIEKIIDLRKKQIEKLNQLIKSQFVENVKFSNLLSEVA